MFSFFENYYLRFIYFCQAENKKERENTTQFTGIYSGRFCLLFGSKNARSVKIV